MDGHLHHQHHHLHCGAHYGRADTPSTPGTGTSPAALPDLNRLALSATLHCLTGCGIGEELGMVLGTAVGCAARPGPLSQPNVSRRSRLITQRARPT